jgi:prepilin-type N-terminal cleavage/methylation domain-containing protein
MNLCLKFFRVSHQSADVRSQNGFTLVELLVALVISGFMLSAGYGIYLTQHQGWIVQEQVSNMQQNIRAALHELENRIRMAGYGLQGGFQPIYAANTNPDTITVLFQDESSVQVPLEEDMPQTSAELRFDGHDISSFEEDTWVYIYDPTADTGEFFYITAVQVAACHIQHNTMTLSRCYPKGSMVMVLNMYKFYLDTSDAGHPNLMVQREGDQAYVYAEDIEDLQLQYGLANGVLVDVPPLGTLVREVQITISARTERTDLQFEGDYRRRTLVSNVKVRNLGS